MSTQPGVCHAIMHDLSRDNLLSMFPTKKISVFGMVHSHAHVFGTWLVLEWRAKVTHMSILSRKISDSGRDYMRYHLFVRF